MALGPEIIGSGPGGESCDVRGCDDRGTVVEYPDDGTVPRLVCEDHARDGSGGWQ